MAALSDVEEGLVSLIASVVFPGASYSSGAYQVSPITNAKLTIARGWPFSADLDKDMAAGTSNITIFSGSGATKNTTRFQPDWVALPQAPPSLTVSYNANTVSFGGTGASGQLAAIGDGNTTYVYPVQSNDTPTTVASSLSALISGSTASNGVFSLPTAIGLIGRVVQQQTAVRELRRQVQRITITIWAPNPSTRDLLSNTVDGAFAGLQNSSGQLTRFFQLPSGENVGPVTYSHTYTDDTTGKDGLWKRDLLYDVEYALYETQFQTPMIFGNVVTTAQTVTGQPVNTTQIIDAKGVAITLNGTLITNPGGTEAV